MYDIIRINDRGNIYNLTILMSYDESGRPFMITYDNVSYYYLLNMQDDVVGIMNVSGDIMVEYTYDAWGKVLSITGPMASTMGQHNQLRYRGYVYDPETNLYYLNSRFYNPETGRFINADIYPSTGQGLTGNNMLAYCGNNPVSRKDDGGKFWNIVIGAVVGAVVSAVTTAIDTYTSTGSIDWGKVGISAAVGAISGGVAATGLGAVAQAGITMAATAAGDILTQTVDAYTTGAKYDPMQTIHNTLLAGGCSILGSGLGFLASYGQTALGSELLEKGAEKAGQAFCRSNLGLSSSKLIRQAGELLEQGRIITNIGRGISSVTGTLLTWGVAVEYSY